MRKTGDVAAPGRSRISEVFHAPGFWAAEVFGAGAVSVAIGTAYGSWAGYFALAASAMLALLFVLLMPRIVRASADPNRTGFLALGVLLLCSFAFYVGQGLGDHALMEEVAQLEENMRSQYQEMDHLVGFLGPSVYEWHVVDVKKDSGTTLSVGDCRSRHCFEITVGRVSDDPSAPTASLEFRGQWEDIDTSLKNATIRQKLRLQKGCEATWGGSEKTIRFVVVDDRYTAARIAVAVVPGNAESGQYYAVGCRPLSSES